MKSIESISIDEDFQALITERLLAFRKKLIEDFGLEAVAVEKEGGIEVPSG